MQKWLWVHELPDAIKRLGLEQRLKDVAGEFSKILVVSQAVQRAMVERFGVLPERMELFPGTIGKDAELTQQSQTIGDLRSWLHLPKAAFLVGMVGSLTLGKGVERFVRIASEVKRLDQDRLVHFLWIGDETKEISRTDANRLAAQYDVSERIHFITFQNQIASKLQQLDLFFLSSLEDSFPLVVLEAARVGIPSMCFADSGGAPEFIEDGRFILDEASEEIAANRILGLLKFPTTLEEVGKRLQEKVNARFTAEVRARELDTLIQTLC